MPLQATDSKRAGAVTTAAVIGSGVMGAGIAAHLANAGMRVLLLDVLPPQAGSEGEDGGANTRSKQESARETGEQDSRQGRSTGGSPDKSQGSSPDRNALAAAAIAAMPKAAPPMLYDPAWVSRLTPGNLADHASALGDVDWIVEAVTERLDIKRSVLELIEKHRRPGSIVSTNTSGLSVAAMAEGRSQEFRRHFAAVHFFNPPRYMKLVEVVPTGDTDPSVVELLIELCEKRLGKGVVVARDTPNFIANRIGAYGMLTTLRDTERFGLTVEEADALTGPLMGRPRTATFRMLDMIGLDTLLHVVDNVRQRAESRRDRELFVRPPLLEALVAKGRLGAKSGEGFYRKLRGGDGRSLIQSIRLDSLEYGPQQNVSSPALDAAKAAKGTGSKLKALLAAGGREADFVWSTLKSLLLYSAEMAGVIADSISDIDRAMRWGFNWELGPFELWDAIGLAESAAKMKEEGEELPEWVESWLSSGRTSFYETGMGKRFYAAEGGKLAEEREDGDTLSLAPLKASGKTIWSGQGASLVDLGDEVACLEFHSPNNAIGGDILSAIRYAAAEVSLNWRGLVIANEGRNFSVGANLMLLLMEAQNGEWEEVEDMIRAFQGSMLQLKRLDRPVVAAPHRMTLGGGVEACLPADIIVMPPETYFGLVETGVGLIPAGGGCKEAAAMAALRAEWPADTAHGGSVKHAGGADVVYALARLQPQLTALFETIAMAKASGSAHEAAKLGLLRPQDRIIRRQDSRIAEAKRAVLELDRQGYSPPGDERIPVAGREGKALLSLAVKSLRLGGHISSHDALIGSKLAHVLSGGDIAPGTAVSPQYLLDLECEAFLSLCGERKTQDRMSHMLATGKPLRN